MKKLTIFFAIALALVSCNGWLDVRPQSETPADELFKKEKGFRDALTECYVKMNSEGLYGRNMTMREVEWLAQHWAANSPPNLTAAAWKNFEYTSNQSVKQGVGEIYIGLYNVIAQANLVLRYLDTHGSAISTEALRKLIRAEALGVRAYCHTDLLRLFGEVPGGAAKVRLPYSEILGSVSKSDYLDFEGFTAKILADISEADKLFAESDPLLGGQAFDAANPDNDFLSWRRFRFNAFAMRAMRLRVLLWRGGAENIAAAYTLSRALIDDLPAMVLAGAGDMNQGRFALPSECILALSNPAMRTVNDATMNASDLFMEPSEIASTLFAGHSTGTNNRGRLWDEEGVLRKFRQPSTTASSGTLTLERALYHEVMPLIRLSEIYLIAMETAPDLAAANALYQTYMEARGELVGPSRFTSREELNAEIMNEYRREFFGEGQMFYLYKRRGEAWMAWKYDRPVGESDYIMPLPSSDILTN